MGNACAFAIKVLAMIVFGSWIEVDGRVLYDNNIAYIESQVS